MNVALEWLNKSDGTYSLFIKLRRNSDYNQYYTINTSKLFTT